MSYICGSSEAAEELRNNLRVNVASIYHETETIEAAVRTLAASCRDASLLEAQDVYTGMYRALQPFMQSFKVLDQRLQAYIVFFENVQYGYCGGVTLFGNGQSGGARTRQVWHKGEGESVFDSPDALGAGLETSQGSSTGLGGSCGLCSCVNVMRMSGRSATEGNVYSWAHANGHCTWEGGTTPQGRQAILAASGIGSTLQKQSLQNIAAAVMEGRGVILSVNANRLYGEHSLGVALHAVTVTSVVLDDKGGLKEIVICDSNADALGDTGARRYPADFIKKCLTGRPMNVTDVIR